VELETSYLVGRLIVASSPAADDKPSLKGPLSGDVNHLKFGEHQLYLWNYWS